MHCQIWALTLALFNQIPKQTSHNVVTKFIIQYSFLPFSKRFRSVCFYVIVRLFRVIVRITLKHPLWILFRFVYVVVFPSFLFKFSEIKQTKIENGRLDSRQLLLCVSVIIQFSFYRTDLTIILIALAK